MRRGGVDGAHIIDGGRPESVDLEGSPEVRGQLLGELARLVDPVKGLQPVREVQFLKARQQLPPLIGRAGLQICQLMLQLIALRRKLPVIDDDFTQQQRQKTDGQLLQQRNQAGSQLSGLRRVTGKLAGL